MHFRVFSRFYYTRLKPNERIIYEQILHGVFGFQEKIMVNGGLSIDDYAKIVMGIRMDIPELFFVDTLKVTTETRGDQTNIILKYLMSPREAEMLKEKIYGVMVDFFSSHRNSENIERDIHDYLAKGIKYNRTELFHYDYSIIGALLNRTCVCEGYAKAFKLLCDQVNIPCAVIVGDSKGEGHAWNIVKLGRNAFHVDVTWNSGIYENGNIPLYYNVSDEFIGQDHQWKREDYPPCKVSGVVEQEIIDVFGLRSFANALEAMVMMRKNEFILRFNKKFQYVEEISELIKTAIEKLELESIGTFSVTYVEKMDCAVVNFKYR